MIPLVQNATAQVEMCNVIQEMVNEWGISAFETSGTIGKRYRRHDEIGTPFCATVDFESCDDRCVTVRNRDTTVQRRIPIDAFRSKTELYKLLDDEV